MGKLVRGVTDLTTVRPDLAAEWHPTKNLDKTPQHVTTGSGAKTWWLCAAGHEWKAQISHRNGGRGCPYCSGLSPIVGKTDLATTNPDLAAEWHPTKNGDLTSREVKSSSNKKAWWLCVDGHEWESVIASRHVGAGCPYCSGYFTIVGVTDLATTNPDLAAEWHPTKNGDLTPRDVSSGSTKKVWWTCAHLHEWESRVDHRCTGSGCPYCSGRFAIVGVTDLATTNPDLAAEWHPTKNGDLTPREVMSGSGKKVWWLCNQDHEWRATIDDRNHGTGCPGCAIYGYDQSSPGYLYLLRKEHLDLQQFGITNFPENRLAKHEGNGWEALDIVGPADGHGIRETETALKNFFREKGVLLPRDYPDKFDGYSESWRSDQLSFSTCAEMLEALRDWEAKV